MGKRIAVSYSRLFLKHATRLPSNVVDQAQKREEIFKADPYDPRLDTHKLHGKDSEAWAFSVSRTYRIKFIFLADNRVLFLDIGTHDIYQ